MHIFIDESGTFQCDESQDHSVSTVGSLVIPSDSLQGFQKLYGRLRQRLPKEKGEVKGRLCSEMDVQDVASVLKKVGALFEVVAIDMGLHTVSALEHHKRMQAEGITKHLTENHYQTMIDESWELRRQLESMPLQLYVQSAAMGELVYNTLNHADLYFAFHRPRELGGYHWAIDAKNRFKVTPWEEWWLTVVLPMIESKTLRNPFIGIEGANYRWQERFRKQPSDHIKQYAKDPENGEFCDLRMVMTEDLRFSSEPEYGLEAVDILTNTIRRSMSGNFSREGWLSIPELMVHFNGHYIRMIDLAGGVENPTSIPYNDVLNDFRSGGRAILPKGFLEN